MPNKITAVCLSFLFLFNLAGYLLIFKLNKEIIRNNYKERMLNVINDDSTILIVLDKSQINDQKCKIFWEKDESELKYNGKLYDVIHSKEINGKVYLYCWNDIEEEELLNNVSLFVNKNFSKINFLAIHYSFYIISEFKTLPRSNGLEAAINYLMINYKSNLPSVPTPPPRMT